MLLKLNISISIHCTAPPISCGVYLKHIHSCETVYYITVTCVAPRDLSNGIIWYSFGSPMDGRVRLSTVAHYICDERFSIDGDIFQIDFPLMEIFSRFFVGNQANRAMISHHARKIVL